MAISQQKEARSRDYALLLFPMTLRLFYSAQYHRQHCTLQVFEQFGTLYMHNHDEKEPAMLCLWLFFVFFRLYFIVVDEETIRLAFCSYYAILLTWICLYHISGPTGIQTWYLQATSPSNEWTIGDGHIS